MGRAKAPTVSNNGEDSIELEKKEKKSKGLKLNEYGNKSVECGGVPISFFIVVRITIITDKKLAAEV